MCEPNCFLSLRPRLRDRPKRWDINEMNDIPDRGSELNAEHCINGLNRWFYAIASFFSFSKLHALFPIIFLEKKNTISYKF